MHALGRAFLTNKVLLLALEMCIVIYANQVNLPPRAYNLPVYAGSGGILTSRE